MSTFPPDLPERHHPPQSSFTILSVCELYFVISQLSAVWRVFCVVLRVACCRAVCAVCAVCGRREWQVDTHGERDAIVQKVLPALNKLLAARDVQVVAVDLRWGISPAESQSNTIQTTCLDEIDRCRIAPDEPAWFVGLRSARYGWVQRTFNPREQFTRQDTFEWLERAWAGCQPHGMSITSMEVWHALLGCSSESKVPHAFFAFRDDSFVKESVDEEWR